MDRPSMDLFGRQVASLLNQVGIESKYEGSTIKCGVVEYDVMTYRRSERTVTIDDNDYTRLQADQCAAYIVTDLLSRIDEVKAQRRREKRQRYIQILAAGGPKDAMGYHEVTSNVHIETAADGKNFIMKFNTADETLFRRALDLVIMLQKGGTIDHDGDALLRTALQSPGDDTPWLIYCDWLEENGQIERGMRLREVVAQHAQDRVEVD